MINNLHLNHYAWPLPTSFVPAKTSVSLELIAMQVSPTPINPSDMHTALYCRDREGLTSAGYTFQSRRMARKPQALDTRKLSQQSQLRKEPRPRKRYTHSSSGGMAL